MHPRLQRRTHPGPGRLGRLPHIARGAVAAACVIAMVMLAPAAIAAGRTGGTAAKAKNGTVTAPAKASPSSTVVNPGTTGSSAAQTLQDGAAAVAQSHKALVAQESQAAPAQVAAAETRAAIESGDERAPAAPNVLPGGAAKLSSEAAADPK